MNLPVTFASPRFLLLLLAIPLAIWVGKRTLAGLEPWRRRMALALRLAGIVLLALATAELQWKDVLDTVQVVFLVDQSLSIPKEEQKVALDVVNAAARTMDPRRDRAKLVVFAKEAYTEATLEKGKEVLATSSDVSREHTDIQNALKVGLGAFDPNVRRRLVLISDGNETMGNAKEGVAQAKLTQTRLDVVPLEYAYENEVLVDKLVMPTEAKIGEPFKVRVVVDAFQPTRAKIHLYEEGTKVDVREVDLAAGANVEVFELILKKPGFFRIGAVVEASDAKDDKLYQNNEGNGFIFVKGESSVLYVHRAGDEDAISRPFLEALERERVSVTVMPATHFPQQASGLQVYDAVILDDVPRDAFSQTQLEAIEFAVDNEGIGLVMIGGEHSFGCGDWRDTPVEKALPVDMDIKEESTIPNGALVIVMHSSELPNANSWAKQVVKASIDTLSRRDQCGLMEYSMMGGVNWVFNLQPVIDKSALKAKAELLAPGDMPDFDVFFESAYRAIKPAEAAVKHMILLSDGDPSPPKPELLKAFKDSRITCSTVAFGAHDGRDGAQHNAMKRIASELGGKCYFIDGPSELPKIFTRETQRVRRSLIVNDRFTPKYAQKSEVLKGIDGLPPLEGHVLTEAKPRAEVPLVSPKGAPILAHWQYGAGKSLAFTSDATNRWAASWVRWNGFQNFWGQAIRWVSKDVQESPFQVTTKVKGETGTVLLDAVDKNGEFVDGLAVEGVVRSPKDKRTNVTLRQVGPGRYEGNFDAGEVGAYTVSVLTKDKQGKRRHSFTTGMVFPYSEEFKKLKTDRVALASFAHMGDGRVIEPKDAIGLTNGFHGFFARDDKNDLDTALRDKWQLVLAICAFVFLLDVACRRVAIDWEKLWLKASAPFRRGPRKEPERAATMERLRHRKEEVRVETLTKFEAKPAQAASAAPAIAGREAEPAEVPAGAAPVVKLVAKPDAPPQYTNRLLEAKRRAMRDLNATEAQKDKGKKDG